MKGNLTMGLRTGMVTETLESLLTKIDKKTGKTEGIAWARRIDKYYLPFIQKIYPSDAMHKILMTTRKTNLYRYWAMHDVKTLEDARKLVHACPMCKKNPSLACSGEPGKGGWLVSCHEDDCIKGYQTLQCKGYTIKKGYSYE